jgi:hypothetical protein
MLGTMLYGPGDIRSEERSPEIHATRRAIKTLLMP